MKKKAKKTEKKIIYTDEPMEFRVIKDFLPSPAELRKWNKKVEVTLPLDYDVINFLRGYAAKDGVLLETLIKNIVSAYASNVQKSLNH